MNLTSQENAVTDGLSKVFPTYNDNENSTIWVQVNRILYLISISPKFKTLLCFFY